MDDPILRILVVDGDHASRGDFCGLIRQSGHQAFEASDSLEGLAKTWGLRPDMIIVQHRLPGMSSVELVREIRAGGDAYQPYIALVASPAERKQWLKVPEAGDDFIDKPLRADIFAAQLRAGQRIVRLQQENERHKRKLQQYSQELICSNLRLRELAMTDELTGLPNRRYSMELMQQEWLAAAKDNLSLSSMVIDLSGLKQINDEQGLERGDVVIKTVAAVMRRYLPSRDTVCRISGDEFLVICPGVALNSALACGDKLVGLIRSFNIQAQGSPLGLNIGVAERRAGVNGPQELINLAEQAMHHAKRTGPNQVVSGHATGLRVVGGGSRAGRKKAGKEFSLWSQVDAMRMMPAGT